ncbi:MAG: hypothetical protein J5J00_13420 [Deltaproteobacteria bacterium]|nr:hypothetical protein [Deltaproteobacteria bacterium]
MILRRFIVAILLCASVVQSPGFSAAQSGNENPECRTLSEGVESAINAARGCANDSECKLVSFGCPFGCLTAINALKEEEIREMVRKYNTKCSPCKYRCEATPMRAVCLKSSCIAVEDKG